jgi:hypothetical protein
LNDFVQPYICSPYDFGPTPDYSTNLEFQVVTFPGKVETISVTREIPQEQEMVERMARIILNKELEEVWPEVVFKTQLVLDSLIQSADLEKVVNKMIAVIYYYYDVVCKKVKAAM